MWIKAGVCVAVRHTGMLSMYNRCNAKPSLSLLTYHRISEDLDPHGLSISPECFRRQIDFLTRNYAIVPLGQAVSQLEAATILRDSVVITFDDGYRDNYTAAYSILREYRTPATIFIACDAVERGRFGWADFDAAIMGSELCDLDLRAWGLGRYPLASRRNRQRTILELHRRLKLLPEVDRKNIENLVISSHSDRIFGERSMLSWDEVREMQQSGLVTIGSHTLSHPILTRVSHASAMEELRESKRILEKRTGAPVEFFAYPNGGTADFDREIADMVRACGYRAACSTIAGAIATAVDLFLLPRRDVTYGVCRSPWSEYSESMFAVKMSGMLDGLLFRV
jgi:peptidoglycan/xylan/chitin deacetylase (PgdA/CDA1 family)